MQRRDLAWFHPFRGPACAASDRCLARERGRVHGDDRAFASGTRTGADPAPAPAETTGAPRDGVRDRRHHRHRRGGGSRGRHGWRRGHGHDRHRGHAGRLRAVGGSLPAPHRHRLQEFAARSAAGARSPSASWSPTRGRSAAFATSAQPPSRSRGRRRGYQTAIDAATTQRVRRHHPARQVAGLHAEERHRHGLLPVLREDVRAAGLAAAADVRAGHPLHPLISNVASTHGRRLRGDARRDERPAAVAQLPLSDGAGGGGAGAPATASGSTPAARSRRGCRTS